jgi:hypothetical protein
MLSLRWDLIQCFLKFQGKKFTKPNQRLEQRSNYLRGFIIKILFNRQLSLREIHTKEILQLSESDKRDTDELIFNTIRILINETRN